MSELSLLYVRTRNKELSDNGLIRLVPDVEVVDYRGWHRMDLSDAAEAPAEDRLLQLSREAEAEIVWVAYQSVVDAFRFHHWNCGEHLRTLVYGFWEEERTWEQADGRPEPWERTALFSEEALQTLLESTETEAEKEELRRLWREGEIVSGRDVPWVDAESCASEILAFYQIEG